MKHRFGLTVSLVLSRVLQRAVRYINPATRVIPSSRLHAMMSGRLAPRLHRAEDRPVLPDAG